MVTNLLKCSYCKKEVDKDFILLKFYEDSRIVATDLFCNIECMVRMIIEENKN
jgi:hypothetical protein